MSVLNEFFYTSAVLVDTVLSKNKTKKKITKQATYTRCTVTTAIEMCKTFAAVESWDDVVRNHM